MLILNCASHRVAASHVCCKDFERKREAAMNFMLSPVKPPNTGGGIRRWSSARLPVSYGKKRRLDRYCKKPASADRQGDSQWTEAVKALVLDFLLSCEKQMSTA